MSIDYSLLRVAKIGCGLLLLFISPIASAQPIDRIDLYMDKDDAAVLFLKDPFDKSSFAVSVGDESDRLSGQIEVKGSFTRRFHKKSLKISLDDDQLWRGQKKFALNAMNTDPSMMRNWLAWNLIGSLGMARPSVSYIRVFINDEFIGLYLYFEWLTPKTFNRFSLGDDGQFFHPVDSKFCGDLTALNDSRLETCWLKLSPRDNDFTSLRQLSDNTSETSHCCFDEFIENETDVDSLINWLVVNTVVSSGDTYNKNYFLYRSSQTKRWTFIPWDYDLSYGRNADSGLTFPAMILNDNFHYSYSPELGNPAPLKEKTLKNARLYAKFRAHLAHVLGVHRLPDHESGFGWFLPKAFSERVQKWKPHLKQLLDKDKYTNWKQRDFDQHLDALIHYNTMRYHMLVKMVLQTNSYTTHYWMPYSAYPSVELLTSEERSHALRLENPTVPPPYRPIKQVIPRSLTTTTYVKERGEEVVPVDDHYIQPLAILRVNALTRPAEIRFEVQAEKEPREVPPGIRRNRCLQRTWFIDSKTPDASLNVHLTLDYLQESSLRNELGAVQNEERLELWMLRQGQWKKLDTIFNSYANTFKVSKLNILPTQMLRFVACERAQ